MKGVINFASLPQYKKVLWAVSVNPIPIAPPLTTVTMGFLQFAIAKSMFTITTSTPYFIFSSFSSSEVVTKKDKLFPEEKNLPPCRRITLTF